MSEPVSTMQPVTVAQMAARFGKSTRWAAAVMRRMRHVPGPTRSMFTTEQWLAEWVAMKAIPSQSWPGKSVTYDPLEEVVNSRVIQLVGALAGAGKIVVRAA